MKDEKKIFKAGSTTYYWSSKFFPKGVRDDVFKLYSFVRVVDNYVDSDTPDIDSFKRIKKRWQSCKRELLRGNLPKRVDDSLQEQVLANMCFVVYRYNCDTAWVDAFLKSMQMDVDGRRYETIEDSLEYVYGSAEVIGLFMAKLLNLPIAPLEPAKLQGRAMQWINFIRDIAEDQNLGRSYFPSSEMKKYHLKNLSLNEAEKKPAEFKKFVRDQIDLYRHWQSQATKGYEYIPRRSRIAVKTAAAMYEWTAQTIYDDPMVVFRRKVKPSKKQVIAQAAQYTIYG